MSPHGDHVARQALGRPSFGFSLWVVNVAMQQSGARCLQAGGGTVVWQCEVRGATSPAVSISTMSSSLMLKADLVYAVNAYAKEGAVSEGCINSGVPAPMEIKGVKDLVCACSKGDAA